MSNDSAESEQSFAEIEQSGGWEPAWMLGSAKKPS
jgi:hypothetical protein